MADGPGIRERVALRLGSNRSGVGTFPGEPPAFSSAGQGGPSPVSPRLSRLRGLGGGEQQVWPPWLCRPAAAERACVQGGDLPRTATGSLLFEGSVVATRRSGRLGSAGWEALNAPTCGLGARSGARAAEMTQGGPSPESHRLEQQQGGPSPVSHRLAAGCRRARGSRRARARSGRGDPPRRGCRR